MSDEIKMVHSYIPTEPQITVKLERGQKGTYAFEIKVEGTDITNILLKIEAIDKKLKETYCSEKGE